MMMSIFTESFLLLVVPVCVCGEGDTDGAEAGLILRNHPGLSRHEVRLGGVTDPVLTALGHSTECVTITTTSATKVLHTAAMRVRTTCDWLLRGMLRSDWSRKSADALSGLV